MKHLLIGILLIATSLSEPQVENRYLPPSQGYRTTNQNSFAPPAQSYGPPDAPQRQTDALFGNLPSNYSPFRSQPSSQYGAPNRLQMRPSNSQSDRQMSQRPSSQYGTPNFEQRQGNVPSGFGQNQPSVEYGAPSRLSSLGQSRPSQMYGPPGQSERQYLPPNRGGNGYDGSSGEDGSNEPVNYSFEYMVKDNETGNDFGHRESRQGGRAEGLYYVLLPDGRKQTVEYEADENGYKPKISYEDTGRGRGGYNGNALFDGDQYHGQSGPY